MNLTSFEKQLQESLRKQSGSTPQVRIPEERSSFTIVMDLTGESIIVSWYSWYERIIVIPLSPPFICDDVSAGGRAGGFEDFPAALSFREEMGTNLPFIH